MTKKKKGTGGKMDVFTLKITSFGNGDLSTKILHFIDMESAFDCMKSVIFCCNVKSVSIEGCFTNPYIDEDDEGIGEDWRNQPNPFKTVTKTTQTETETQTFFDMWK